MSYIFKLRQKSTGLYSTGGSYPNWKKRGKIWETQASLKTSLRAWIECQFSRKKVSHMKLHNICLEELQIFLSDYEIVQYEMVEKGVSDEVTDYLTLYKK